jgi:hypothetical protein
MKNNKKCNRKKCKKILFQKVAIYMLIVFFQVVNQKKNVFLNLILSLFYGAHVVVVVVVDNLVFIFNIIVTDLKRLIEHFNQFIFVHLESCGKKFITKKKQKKSIFCQYLAY